MYSQLMQDEKNKEFKLYIPIDKLKEQLRIDMNILFLNGKYYKETVDYICNNLHSEEDIREYLNNTYHSHMYTMAELDNMEYDIRSKIVQENSAQRNLYYKQSEYMDETAAVKLKCIECGHIQDTYPRATYRRNPCEKCNSTVFVGINTKLDKDSKDIICCDNICELSMLMDSFYNCHATHVYKCKKCNKEYSVCLFKKRR